MSITPTASPVLPGLTPVRAPGVRRVRHQARETMTLMAFSAATSVGFSVVLLLVLSLGR